MCSLWPSSILQNSPGSGFAAALTERMPTTAEACGITHFLPCTPPSPISTGHYFYLMHKTLNLHLSNLVSKDRTSKSWVSTFCCPRTGQPLLEVFMAECGNSMQGLSKASQAQPTRATCTKLQEGSTPHARLCTFCCLWKWHLEQTGKSLKNRLPFV